MRKMFIFTILLLVLSTLVASNVQSGSRFKADKTYKPFGKQITPLAPYDFTFEVAPLTIQTDYFNYCMGAYDGYSIVNQPSTGKIYMNYHAKSTTDATRRMYAAMIDNGGMEFSQSIIVTPQNGGYGTSAIDPLSNYPFTTWHYPGTGDQAYDVLLSYHNSINFSTPQEVFHNTDVNNEYIWPVIYISNSPIANKSRVYIFGSNGGTAVSGLPASNVKLAMADFDQDDLDNETPLNFTFRTFSYLDGMFNAQPENRAYLSYGVTDDGKIAIAGYVSCDSAFVDAVNPEITYQPHNFAVIYNDNYGEGDFSTHTFNAVTPLAAPTDEGGVADPALATYSNFKVELTDCTRRNVTFDNFGKVHVPCMASVTFDVDGVAKYWPNTSYVKDLVYNPTTQELEYYDIWPKGDNPSNETFVCPWDFNEDGIVDSFYTNPDDPEDPDNGSWKINHRQYPIEYYLESEAYPYNYFRMTKPTANGMIATLWMDSYKAQQFYDDNADYAAYANVPELYISISENNGLTWSDPTIMNSIITPEFENLIPVTFYLSDTIVPLGDNNYRLDMMFLDDNSYGSSENGNGPADGGFIKYMALSFHATPNHDVTGVKPSTLKQNYPNPFNPSTTIEFNLQQPSKVDLSIYNIKGQLVKTLVKEVKESGNHKITWNGVDNNNNSVSSGVYFYKLSTAQHSEMKKMILVK